MASGCESDEVFISGPEDHYFPQNQEGLYLPSDTQSQGSVEAGHEQSGYSSEEVSDAENDDHPRRYHDEGIVPAKRRKVRPCQDDHGKKRDGINGSSQPRVSLTPSPGQGLNKSLTQTPRNPKHSQRQDGGGLSHSRRLLDDSRRIQRQDVGGPSSQRDDSRRVQRQDGGGPSSQRDDSRRVQRQDGGGPSPGPSQRDDSRRVQRQDGGGPSRVQTPCNLKHIQKRGSEGELSEIKLLLNSLCETVKEIPAVSNNYRLLPRSKGELIRSLICCLGQYK